MDACDAGAVARVITGDLSALRPAGVAGGLVALCLARLAGVLVALGEDAGVTRAGCLSWTGLAGRLPWTGLASCLVALGLAGLAGCLSWTSLAGRLVALGLASTAGCLPWARAARTVAGLAGMGAGVVASAVAGSTRSAIWKTSYACLDGQSRWGCA